MGGHSRRMEAWHRWPNRRSGLDDQASRERWLEQALEVCRPDGLPADDAASAFLAAEMAARPGVAERYRRLQGLDARIAAAMREVPVPGDLAGRLMARLAAERPAREVSRRWLLAGSGLLAAAAGLLVAVWLGLRGGQPLSQQYVLDEAIRSFENSPPELQHWLSDSPPGGFPFSGMLLPGRQVRWQAIADFVGRHGVAYDLSGTEAGRATLFVVAGTVEGLGPAPALQPFTTAGCCASAWQENGLVYVLVVEGDPTAYQSHLRLPTGPIA